MMERIVIAGAGGQLGSALRSHFADYDVIVLHRSGLMPGELASTARKILEAKPSAIINCAASTDVEGAEQDPAADRLANAVLPGQLSAIAREAGAHFIHFSSTGCYGSWKSEPYCEEDELRPTTQHHAAKTQGEAAAIANNPVTSIVRLGWLYGGSLDNPKNFVAKRLAEAKTNRTIRSDAIQKGCPTNVADVAAATAAIMASRQPGIFNAVAEGAASRFEYVQQIVVSSGFDCEVIPGPQFKRLAAVSMNEAALNCRLDDLKLHAMPNWRSSLNDYVKHLIKSSF